MWMQRQRRTSCRGGGREPSRVVAGQSSRCKIGRCAVGLWPSKFVAAAKTCVNTGIQVLTKTFGPIKVVGFWDASLYKSRGADVFESALHMVFAHLGWRWWATWPRSGCFDWQNDNDTLRKVPHPSNEGVVLLKLALLAKCAQTHCYGQCAVHQVLRCTQNKEKHETSHRLMLCCIPTNSNTRILGFGATSPRDTGSQEGDKPAKETRKHTNTRRGSRQKTTAQQSYLIPIHISFPWYEGFVHHNFLFVENPSHCSCSLGVNPSRSFLTAVLLLLLFFKLRVAACNAERGCGAGAVVFS